MIRPYLTGLLACVLLSLMPACKTIIKVPVPNPPLGGQKIASVHVQPFESNDHRSGEQFANMLAHRIHAYGYVATTGTSSPVLKGSLDFSKPNYESWKDVIENKSKDKDKQSSYVVYHYRVKQDVRVSFSVMDGQHRLLSDSLSFSVSDQQSSTKSYSQAKSELASPTSLAYKLMDQAAEKMSKYISPYPSDIRLTFLEGDDKTIDLGIEYAKRKRYSQAFAIFDQVANQTKDSDDQAIALHNQGMIRLIEGAHQEAFELMSKANQIDPGNIDILDSLALVETLKLKADAMKAYQ